MFQRTRKALYIAPLQSKWCKMYMTCNVPRMLFTNLWFFGTQYTTGVSLTIRNPPKNSLVSYLFLCKSKYFKYNQILRLKGIWYLIAIVPHLLCHCTDDMCNIITVANKTTNEHQKTKASIHLVLDVSPARFWVPVLINGTVDSSEIPFPTAWDGAKTLKNNGIFTISTGDCRISGCHQPYFITQTRKNTVPWCPRKLGSMVRIDGLFHLLINRVFDGVKNALIRTFDPNFLGQPSSLMFTPAGAKPPEAPLPYRSHWWPADGWCMGRSFDFSTYICPLKRAAKALKNAGETNRNLLFQGRAASFREGILRN